MATTYKVKVFSDNGTIIVDKDIRADKIHSSSNGIIYLTKDNEDIFVGPVSNTVIEKS
jgi:hypothetical protein